MAFNAPADESSSVAASSIVKPSGPAPITTPSWEPKVDRWLDLTTLSYSNRYRSVFDADGAHSFSQGQQRILATGKFKFDAAGQYGIGFHLSSGRYFNWSYADYIGGGQSEFLAKTEAKMTPTQQYILAVYGTPVPTGFLNSGGGQVYLRQLFLTAEPIRGITAEFGGIAIKHGVNSEATSYDDDGYMSGERLTIKRPKQIWLSEVSYTRGYLGDLYKPNFFARADRLSTANYWQILGRKDFGERVSVSADYTVTTPDGNPDPLKTTREGIFADVHESKVFDSARFEAYQRTAFAHYAGGSPIPTAKGYALTVTRAFKKFASVDAGLVNVDTDYIGYIGSSVQAIILGLTVNGDQYGIGKRYFVRPTIPLTSYMSLTGYFNHVYGDSIAQASAKEICIWNTQAVTAGLVFDVKKLFFHPHAL